MALIRVKVAQKRKLGACTFSGGNVGDQHVNHAAPLLFGRPGRVAQGDFGGSANPVAVGEMVVVELLYGKKFFGVSGHGALVFVQVEVGVAFALEPLLGAALDHRQQAVAAFQVALLFHHVHEFEDALQALALPVGAFAFFKHHAPGVALVGLEHIAQIGAARAFGHAGPKGHKALVRGGGGELRCRQELDLAANGVVGRAQARLHRSVVKPLVRIQAQQRAVVRPLHGFGAGAKGGLHLAACFVVGPVHPSALDKCIGMAAKLRHGVCLVVGQGGGGYIALACGQTPDPFGGGHLFPASARGAKQRIGLAAHAQGQGAGVAAVVKALARAGQAQAHIAPADLKVSKGAAVGNGSHHVVGAARHGNINRPVAHLGKLGLPDLKRHGRYQQRLAVRVLDDRVAPLGGHHLFAGVDKFQPLRGGAHGDGLHKQGLGLGVVQHGGIPLGRLRRRGQQRVGAQRGLRDRAVAAFGRQEVAAGAEFYGLGAGCKRQSGGNKTCDERRDAGGHRFS